ncbi:jg11637 [Pararge aegeria aegeria]|uniref:Jg11637 protein n=1 Tax=Pararge aegeria aegeria TaxID=348720 RepID=A0A8S4RL18_9NEOP|nr:jg11637 [Pararge aegeria aegeria]
MPSFVWSVFFVQSPNNSSSFYGTSTRAQKLQKLRRGSRGIAAAAARRAPRPTVGPSYPARIVACSSTDRFVTQTLRDVTFSSYISLQKKFLNQYKPTNNVNLNERLDRVKVRSIVKQDERSNDSATM